VVGAATDAIGGYTSPPPVTVAKDSNAHHLRYTYTFPKTQDLGETALLMLIASGAAGFGALGMVRLRKDDEEVDPEDSVSNGTIVVGSGIGVGVVASIITALVAFGNTAVPVGAQQEEAWTGKYYSAATSLPSYGHGEKNGEYVYYPYSFTLKDKAGKTHYFKIKALPSSEGAKKAMGADISEITKGEAHTVRQAYDKAPLLP
jgi:hypothetical protein